MEMIRIDSKLETKSPILRELKVSIAPESIQEYMEKSFKSLQKTAAIKGFRKGKVPLQLLRQYYLEDVKNDVLKQVLRDGLWEAVKKHEIQPVGTPSIQTIEGSELVENTPVTFTAHVEIFPEIKLKKNELSKIKIKKTSDTMGPGEIEKSLENLRESHAEVITFESESDQNKPVVEGDYVEITYEGLLDGKPHEDLKGNRRLVHVGKKHFLEEFEKAILGMKKGETKTVSVTFTKDDAAPLVAGKTIEFTLTLDERKKCNLPALDDEFAKRFKFETLSELREKIEKNLKEDRKREAKSKTRESLMQALIAMHEFDVPNALIESQVKHLMDELVSDLQRQAFTEKMIRDYITRNHEEIQKRAAEQVRAYLILDRIAMDENLKATDAEMDAEYASMAERMKMDIAQVKAFYVQSENAERQLRLRLTEERVIDFLLKQVKIEN